MNLNSAPGIDKVLATVVHGSKLYQLDSPQSDTDYKSVFLPRAEGCLLGDFPRNTRMASGEGNEKVEHEGTAIQEFIKLLVNGEDMAITMLHAEGNKLLLSSALWDTLVANRKKLYNRSMRGSLGYAKSQCLKYGYRADRMAVVEKIISILELAVFKGVAKLSQMWDELPEEQYCQKVINDTNRSGADKRVYEVAGKGLPATIAPAYALDILVRLRDGYGERVRAAKAMGGKDLKAISHSFRVGYQLKAIYISGDFQYPLAESSFIRDVKEGKLSYVDDRLDEKLNNLITEVEQLAEVSKLPDKVDVAWLNSLILKEYKV
jgi:hypothetical protein